MCKIQKSKMLVSLLLCVCIECEHAGGGGHHLPGIQIQDMEVTLENSNLFEKLIDGFGKIMRTPPEKQNCCREM